MVTISKKVFKVKVIVTISRNVVFRVKVIVTISKNVVFKVKFIVTISRGLIFKVKDTNYQSKVNVIIQERQR